MGRGNVDIAVARHIVVGADKSKSVRHDLEDAAGLLAAVERAGFLTRFLSRLWSCFLTQRLLSHFLPCFLTRLLSLLFLTVILIIIPWFLKSTLIETRRSWTVLLALSVFTALFPADIPRSLVRARSAVFRGFPILALHTVLPLFLRFLILILYSFRLFFLF